MALLWNGAPGKALLFLIAPHATSHRFFVVLLLFLPHITVDAAAYISRQNQQ